MIYRDWLLESRVVTTNINSTSRGSLFIVGFLPVEMVVRLGDCVICRICQNDVVL